MARNRIRRLSCALTVALVTAAFARGETTWATDVPPDQTPIVEAYVRLFLEGEPRERVVSAFDFARYFFGFVEKRLEEAGLPAELAYLPIIESGYNPRATSPSGAAGIWQFMMNTTGEYDLTVDDSIDERRDFWNATDAALEKLAKDYARFGDWFLALAAYNCGPNCVQQALEDTGYSEYWQLSAAGALPAETVAFVPKFLAIIEVAERLNELGYEDWKPFNWGWTKIPVTAPIHLGLVAKLSGIPIELIRLGNAELSHDVTPSHVPDYHLKVPEIYADIIGKALKKPEVRMSSYLVHRIKPGDTLSSLSRRYGVALSSIAAFNPDLKPRLLQINTGVIIPDARIGPHETVHVVSEGETLWSIAQEYATSTDTIAARNAIDDPEQIFAGLLIAIPGDRNRP